MKIGGKSTGLLKVILKLTSLTLLANLLGFLIPIYIANVYGVTKETDDFLLSYGIITFIGVIFSSSVSASLVPFLKERLANRQEFNEFSSAIFRYCLKYVGLFAVSLFFVIMTLCLWLGSKLCMYLALSVPIFFFIVVNAFYYGILNSLGKFNLAATSPFSRAVIIFLCIFVFHRHLGIFSVILGYNLGEFAKFVHLSYVIKKKNDIDLSVKTGNSNDVKAFIKTSFYQATSSTISSSSPLVDKIVASFLMVGSVSLLDYGNRLVTVLTVLLNAFLVVILSKWSGDIAKDKFKIKEFKKIILYFLIGTTLLFLITWIFKDFIVGILYPKLTSLDRDVIEFLFITNMIAFIFNASTQVVNRAIIAFKQTNLLVRTSIVRLIINVIFDLVLVVLFGLKGIVIASVIASAVCMAYVFYLFIKFTKHRQEFVLVKEQIS